MSEWTSHGDPAPRGGHDTDLSSEAFLITDAQESYEAQHRARVRKYLTLMGFRVPALAIAGLVYSATSNGLLALGIVALSIPLPWVAVLVANDRPPRKRGVVPNYLHGHEHPVIGPQHLQPADHGTNSTRGTDSRTVEGHTVDPDD